MSNTYCYLNNNNNKNKTTLIMAVATELRPGTTQHRCHEQHVLLPQQQQQQQKQDYSDHGCRHRAQGTTQHRCKVQAPVIREVDEEVKLAATAISLNVRLRSSSNMPHHMQSEALKAQEILLLQIYFLL
ncbi:hypothetical protein ACLB2K_032115 [Fragaria x ananassa]